MTERRGKVPASEKTGVVATTRELAELRGEAKRLSLNVSGKAKAVLAGPFRSPFRGRGMEFEEVRAYQPGDDPRTIDWRVSARTGRTYSKLFSEERERPVVFLVDAGKSMRFGTRGAFKSVVAARAAACLAWAGFEAGDRIGGIVRAPAGHVDIPPRRGKRRVFSFVNALACATAESLEADAGGAEVGLSFARQLARLRRLATPGSRTFVISDFYELDEVARLQLAQLARRTDLTCIMVSDPLEESPPPPGTYRVSDGRSKYTFTVGDKAWREAWVARFTARRDALREVALKSGAAVVALRTEDDIAATLARAFSSRPGRPGARASQGGTR